MGASALCAHALSAQSENNGWLQQQPQRLAVDSNRQPQNSDRIGRLKLMATRDPAGTRCHAYVRSGTRYSDRGCH